ncbi:hypothetical protein CD178_02213 [Komagataeibacter saccharivorans]|uniref:Lipoprotein n=1 Tax=Komagataeibacter saccharivorans TaxID=265959 RepID=A0A347WDM2_9PROT|nr:hypothetical protein [Komagataeibacter saccharivorans]AXY22965.1 hypothetical protein CD178_02213 [Komagataeibacter saccharivorans]GBQ34984.1 hypothetical protein AA0614_0299 [Komagataeibacter saccharivorans NRIC 0614]
MMKKTVILAGLFGAGLNVAMLTPVLADTCDGVTDHAECEVRLKARETGHATTDTAHKADHKAAEAGDSVKNWGQNTGKTLDKWGHNTKGDMSQFFTGHR